MTTRLLGVAIVVIGITAAAVGAQQHATHARPAAVTGQQIPFHHLCAANGASDDHRAASHTTHLKSALSLTDAQVSTIERVTTEACAAMKKFHDEIIAVLTPEQRARLHELHGSGGH